MLKVTDYGFNEILTVQSIDTDDEKPEGENTYKFGIIFFFIYLCITICLLMVVRFCPIKRLALVGSGAAARPKSKEERNFLW